MDIYVGAREEFLVDEAAYFKGQKQLYLEIKQKISDTLNIQLSMIRICGSAYWGKSFTRDRNFIPGESDLDVALISENMFVRLLSETRSITKNFSNLTHFPRGSDPETFCQYAYKKGIIRVDIMPSTSLKRHLNNISREISGSYLDHFEKITFSVYDTEVSFTNKQAQAFKKFRIDAK